jgi:RNase P subunit RPR2
MRDNLIILGLLVVFIAVLIFVVRSIFLYIRAHRPLKKDKGVQRYNACPLCGTNLIPGENLVSRIYSQDTSSGSDKPCTIHGCPYCYPEPTSENIVRVCPVCNKIVPDDGYLLARIFYRNNQKQHVHVVGCSECHKKV